MRKKEKAAPLTHVECQIRLPVPMISFYEGVAAYARVSLSDAINVVLAVEMCKRGAGPTP